MNKKVFDVDNSKYNETMTRQLEIC